MELNKILERDLKLACLIPTHCTGKASGSYCTSSPRAQDTAGSAQGAGLSVCTSYLSSVDFVKLGMGLHLPHFPSFLIMDKETSWRGRRKKEKKKRLQPSCDFLGWDLCEHFLHDEWGVRGGGKRTGWLFLPLCLLFSPPLSLSLASVWQSPQNEVLCECHVDGIYL